MIVDARYRAGFVHAVGQPADKNLYAVNFNFNGWGQEDTGAPGWRKDPEKAENGIGDQRDRRPAGGGFHHSQTGATKISTWLVMEGGIGGWQGTAIAPRAVF